MVFTLLGASAAGFALYFSSKFIDSRRANFGGAAWEEAPETIVRNFSHEGGISSVGGLIQTGRGTKRGFYLWPTIQHVVNGEGITEKVIFRGLDVYGEIGNIGPCSVFIGNDHQLP